MNQTVRFQEILRRLAIIDEGFAEDQAGLGLACPPPGCWMCSCCTPPPSTRRIRPAWAGPALGAALASAHQSLIESARLSGPEIWEVI